ncbi:MAG: hypothetical protein HUK06_06870 [Bacteroidaceae bacterium]|nr:hypothetical protein [Bacteroidaceae bacterium]
MNSDSKIQFKARAKAKAKAKALLLLLLLATVCRAQNDPEATIRALSPVILEYHGQLRMDSTDLVKQIVKRHAKNPRVITAIAGMFYEAQDSAAAHRFEEMALQFDPKYTAAYVLRGNACLHLYQDTIAAKYWFQKAIDIAPNDPLGYQAMFNYHIKQKNAADSTSAMNFAQQLIEHATTDNGKMAAAEIVKRTGGDKETSVALLEDISLDNMKEEELSRYAYLLCANNMTEKCQKAVDKGIAEYPDNHYFYRIAMYNYAHAANYPEADKMGVKLFSMMKSDSLATEDYRIYSYCYTAKGENEKAIALLWKANEITNPEWAAQQQLFDRIEEVYKIWAGKLAKEGKYDEAAAVLQAGIDDFFNHNDEYRAVHCYSALGTMYAQTWAEELNGAEKLEPYRKALAMYKDMAERCTDEDYITSGIYRQFFMAYFINRLAPEENFEPYAVTFVERVFSHSKIGYYDKNIAKALQVLATTQPAQALNYARRFKQKYPDFKDKDLDDLIAKLSV